MPNESIIMYHAWRNLINYEHALLSCWPVNWTWLSKVLTCKKLCTNCIRNVMSPCSHQKKRKKKRKILMKAVDPRTNHSQSQVILKPASQFGNFIKQVKCRDEILDQVHLDILLQDLEYMTVELTSSDVLRKDGVSSLPRSIQKSSQGSLFDRSSELTSQFFKMLWQTNSPMWLTVAGCVYPWWNMWLGVHKKLIKERLKQYKRTRGQC